MRKVIFAFLLLFAMLGLYELSKNPQFSTFFLNKQKQQISTQTTSGKQLSSTPTPTVTPAIQSISVTDSGFIPQKLTIKSGTTVTWTNNASGPVNISSDPYPLNNKYPPLNLGNFNKGESLSLTFNKPGAYPYHNHIIPPQTGTIVVQ